MRSYEFDLAGERVALGEEELEWLLEQAQHRAGSSSAAADLATMLEAVLGGSRHHGGPLVLHRGERRALSRLLRAEPLPGPGLQQPRALLGPD